MSRYPHSKKPVYRVREVFSTPDSKLNNLLRHASELSRLESLLHRIVGPELAAQIQVAAVRKNRLTVITPTATWATTIRYQATGIIQSLHSAGVTDIDHIDIRVAPLAVRKEKQRKRRSLSPAAQHALEAMSRLDDKDKK